MLTPEQVAELLADRNMAKISEVTGVDQRVLYRIRKKPQAMVASDFKLLTDYFEKQMRAVGFAPVIG